MQMRTPLLRHTGDADEELLRHTGINYGAASSIEWILNFEMKTNKNKILR